MTDTNSLLPAPDRLALVTDLYQLTMAAAYHRHAMTGGASFELFARRLPARRGFLVAAGLAQAVDYLEHLRFDERDVAYLGTVPGLDAQPADFFDALARLRFTGDLDAVPEGTAVFPNEPVLRVTAPLVEAQIIETFLLATINFQTLIATKAARVSDAAKGRDVIDFGLRRAHGPAAGIAATRASFIGGCGSTSNVWAARELGIPAVGTMAHAWVMAHDREEDAFRRFAALFPGGTTLLIDTYDTIEGAKLAARIPGVRAVRLDSGDMLALSKEVRRILDAAGARDCKIVASGDLNEYKIASLLAGQAPIDAFGVGTELVTSADAPALGGVYKLVSQDVAGQWVDRAKDSPDKATYPGRKQIFRAFEGGTYRGDIVGGAEERLPGEPLLQPVLRHGRRVADLPSLREIQARARQDVSRLPAGVRHVDQPERYPVTFSEALEARRRALRAKS
jgi:nicotinate phosphoribosyltransferase